MVEAMASSVSAAHAKRPPNEAERAQLAKVREWSRQLAMDARLLASIDGRDCVALLDDAAYEQHGHEHGGGQGYPQHREEHVARSEGQAKPSSERIEEREHAVGSLA